MYRAIICGPRNFNDYKEVCKAIESTQLDISEIVHGDATGVDTLAGDYANEKKISCKVFPANWNDLTAPGATIKVNTFGKKYNAKAGFDRNKKTAQYASENEDGKIPVCISIKMNTPGTDNMVKTAKEAGLMVYEYEPYKDVKRTTGYLHEF